MKKRRGAIRARLGVVDHRSTTPRWGNPVSSVVCAIEAVLGLGGVRRSQA